MKQSDLELWKTCKTPLVSCPPVPAVTCIDSHNSFYLKEMMYCLKSLKSMVLINFCKYSLYL